RRAHTGCERVFHGPGDGSGVIADVTIDNFANRFWVTWHGKSDSGINAQIVEFLKNKNASAVVAQDKPGGAPAGLPARLFSLEAESDFECLENGLRYKIKFENTRHPGLFLDHEPLRNWLKENSKGLSVLNTFCDTGSLSVAAFAGGAASITNLDLSKPAIEWSKENLNLNFPSGNFDFIYGDVFEWLPRFIKKDRKFGIVIADPPSSSHGTKGHFSTAKDFAHLAQLAMNLVEPGGFLVLSINSYNVSWERFIEFIGEASAQARFKGREVIRFELPKKSFPVASKEDSYLKGVIFKNQA
ncbi:MAG: class I SAM-dependent methyltransferase, partial [Bdellovibrionia bacterium]